MRLASLRIKIPGNWIGDISSQCDLSVKVLRCVPNGENGGMSFLQIDSNKDVSLDDIEERIRTIMPTCKIQFSQSRPGRILGTVDNKKCRVCSTVTESGCFLDSASSDANGDIIWKVIAPNAKSLQELVEKVKSLGCEICIQKVYSMKTERELTEAQEKVLQIAYDFGYYDIPKKIDLAKLANNLEVSKTTLNIMLRRAQRKIIAHHISSMMKNSTGLS